MDKINISCPSGSEAPTSPSQSNQLRGRNVEQVPGGPRREEPHSDPSPIESLTNRRVEPSTEPQDNSDLDASAPVPLKFSNLGSNVTRVIMDYVSNRDKISLREVSLQSKADATDGIQHITATTRIDLETKITALAPGGIKSIYLPMENELDMGFVLTRLAQLLPSLEKLTVGCHYNEAPIIPILPTGLQELEFTEVSQLDIDILPNNLKQLEITNEHCSQTDFEHFDNLPRSLESLKLHDLGSHNLGDADFHALPPSLKTLSFQPRINITDEAFKSMPSELETLHIPISKHLTGANLKKLTDLKDLNISGGAMIENTTLEKLPENLKILNASRCPKLTSLTALPESLENLDVTGCRNLGTDSVLNFPTNLKVLKIGGCKNISVEALATLPLGLELLEINRQNIITASDIEELSLNRPKLVIHGAQ